ncbi:HET-domain-containing protein, partial [Lophiostoma macrostomum CBS 122681]
MKNLEKVQISAVWINALGSERRQRLRSPSLSILILLECPSVPSGQHKVVVRAVSRMLPNQPYFGAISQVQTSYLDYGQIKTWLENCEMAHELCKKTYPTRPMHSFRVIDVEQDCVVDAPDHCRFCALSYVWGDTCQLQLTRANSSHMKQKGALREVPLALTIRDAIECTRGLGERYLWVDSLCIVQDSDEIRQQCIDDMSKIYAHSLLTIVAATCRSANEPLPGVSSKRTWQQWHQEVSPNLTICAQFDSKDYLQNTTYNTRAWTYQEYQLANRLLIFSPNGQVYFSCKCAMHSEEVMPGANLESDAAMLEGAMSSRLQFDHGMLWSTYRSMIEEYTKRSMRREHDILNALTGILNTLVDSRHIAGLPFAIFDMALLWQPRQRLRRRRGFPSWSWAGWVGQIHWFDDGCLDTQKG